MIKNYTLWPLRDIPKLLYRFDFREVYRTLKYYRQYLKTGFDNSVTWSLDSILIKYLYDLHKFNESGISDLELYITLELANRPFDITSHSDTELVYNRFFELLKNYKKIDEAIFEKWIEFVIPRLELFIDEDTKPFVDKKESKKYNQDLKNGVKSLKYFLKKNEFNKVNKKRYDKFIELLPTLWW